MAAKKTNSGKNKKAAVGKAPASAPTSQKANKIMARVLIVVVFLACVWEGLQTMNKDVPKLKIESVLKLSADIKGAGTFIPWGAAAVGKDKVVVADNQNNRLLEFDRKGDFLKSWGTTGKAPGDFHEPSGMTSDDKGNAYVVDCWNSAIKGFDEKGKEVALVDLSNQGFFGPRGVGFSNGNFVIADTGSHRIVTVSPKGQILSSWGSIGTDDSHFKGPLAIATDGKGRYYVADTDNNRVQILDATGKEVKTLKFSGAVSSVAVDHEGHIYVGTKADDGQVKVFSNEGKVLGTLVDNSGSGEPFRDAKFMSITPDDKLLMTSGDSVLLYNLPSFVVQK